MSNCQEDRQGLPFPRDTQQTHATLSHCRMQQEKRLILQEPWLVSHSRRAGEEVHSSKCCSSSREQPFYPPYTPTPKLEMSSRWHTEKAFLQLQPKEQLNAETVKDYHVSFFSFFFFYFIFSILSHPAFWQPCGTWSRSSDRNGGRNPQGTIPL